MSVIQVISLNLTLSEGEERTLTLAPKGTGTIHGRVQFSGTLPEGVTAHFRLAKAQQDPNLPFDQRPSSRAAFVKDGAFVFESVEPGDYMVFLNYSDFSTKRFLSGQQTVSILEGETKEIMVELRGQ